jgi:hypothetical protein
MKYTLVILAACLAVAVAQEERMSPGLEGAQAQQPQDPRVTSPPQPGPRQGVQAQQAPPQPAQPQPAPAQPAQPQQLPSQSAQPQKEPVAPNNSGAQAGSASGDSKFLGKEVPFLDPGSNIVSWDGKSWHITNNALFEARFEKYLNAPPAVFSIS